MEEEDKRQRRGWKILSDEAVKKLRAAPDKGKRGRERYANPVGTMHMASTLEHTYPFAMQITSVGGQ